MQSLVASTGRFCRHQNHYQPALQNSQHNHWSGWRSGNSPEVCLCGKLWKLNWKLHIMHMVNHVVKCDHVIWVPERFGISPKILMEISRFQWRSQEIQNLTDFSWFQWDFKISEILVKILKDFSGCVQISESVRPLDYSNPWCTCTLKVNKLTVMAINMWERERELKWNT